MNDTALNNYGLVSVNGGTLFANNSAVFTNMQGGTLAGKGAIDSNLINAGQLILGGTAQAGLLTINSNYIQTTTGSLDIELGGTTAGSQYDQLGVSGTATLGGQLDVCLIDNFQPALGNTFRVLTFASSSGNFGFYNGIVLGNRLLLDPALNSTNLTLTVQPVVGTTTLSAPPSPSVSGQSLTFTATVTVALPPTTIDPTPTGTVTFYDNGSSIGTGTLSVVNGEEQASYTTSTLSTASHAITAAYTSGDSNFVPSSPSAAVTQVVNRASTSATVATSLSPSVYGQGVMFTATVSVVGPGSTAVASPTGTVTFYDGGQAIGTGTLSVVSGQNQATLSTSTLGTATHTITAAYTSGDGNVNASPVSAVLAQVVNKDSTTTSVSDITELRERRAKCDIHGDSDRQSARLRNALRNRRLLRRDDKHRPHARRRGDCVGHGHGLDDQPGGRQPHDQGDLLRRHQFPHQQRQHRIDHDRPDDHRARPLSRRGISLSGNASISLTGGIYVDSNSSTAISASGNAAVKASVIDVSGKVSKSGNASFSPAPVTGAAAVADPLATLNPPSTSGLTTYGSESLSGTSSATINPGIYSKITVSGTGTLTMSSGIYIIEGGGFSVSGNASISGSGVLIVNAGGNYPSAGGSYGGITLTGNGSYNLSPPSTGTYAGILIYQTRDTSKALTLSGNASGMSGTIYAPAAQVAESGNAELNAAIIADTMTISGNGVANAVTLDAPSGTVAYTPAQIRAAYGITALGGSPDPDPTRRHRPDHRHRRCLRRPEHLPITRRVRLPVRADHVGAVALCPVRTGFLVLDRAQSKRPGHVAAGYRPEWGGFHELGAGGALDVEWAHAIAPGAQIILVEANSQSLSDLIASVATAARQPGVSVVSMSWGFPEGQSVFAADEATYDSVFNVPGVTFIASTGDYGAADPEYPAFSPNVVAVGGTSLTLNTDGSYNSEIGWGYNSSAAGGFIGSGGGISLYEPEPAYQQGVQSTGYRTTPDVSLVADPATGAWIADPYNLDPSNPFEIVGGTSLSAPAWAGLFALVNQGRAAAGGAALNSTNRTATQQALYALPQSDYNAIASGNNGYSAGSGYNLVTGLGTPVASSLVPDLVAYQGPGTSYAGPGVGPLQDATLVDPMSTGGGPIDVFSVFDALTVGRPAAGQDRTEVKGSADLSTASLESPATVATNQVLMALDSVIEGWTPGGSTAIKRLVSLTSGSTILPGTGWVKVLPAMIATKTSRVVGLGILDTLLPGTVSGSRTRRVGRFSLNSTSL